MNTGRDNSTVTDGRPHSDPGAGLVLPNGMPATPSADTACPTCLASADRRQASGGFGVPHPVCGVCGHEFHDEVWSV